MPAKLCTAEYFQQVADALNADEDFRDDAENFSFYFLFQVTDDPTVMCAMKFENGVVTECRNASEADADVCGYVVTATRESWEKLATGKLNAISGIVTGRIKLKKGSKMELVKNLDSAGQIFEEMAKIPFE
ncbi:MAG: SCP2 sterol-binding domain-containing protein [Coriobacteriales bacterium]|nr:SCP2 sterol-binding domain-containing protein [Coriobacteriales bacterium]MBQ6586645.1 SCP2 sterol-binding domain-containing protein [Coriobacteriales bacterium]